VPESPITKSGPKILTNLAQVNRRANDLAEQNVRFRVWVKFGCKLTDHELDAVVREVTDEVWSHIDCTACGQCCKALRITVDADDISRLSKRTGMGAMAFMRRHVREKSGEKYLAQSPCSFLRGNSCSIYEDRPKACADFPYLHAESFRERMLMMIENSFVCPVVFNTLEALKRKLAWNKK